MNRVSSNQPDNHVIDPLDGEDDEFDFFESALESLFGQHQPASGKSGSKYQFRLSESFEINYRIPLMENSSNNRLFAHYQWDAGKILATLLFDDSQKLQHLYLPKPIRGLDVLELGAGTGLPGLTCAKLEAREVCITDYPDQGIINAIKESISMNKLDDFASAEGLNWGNDTQIDHVCQRSSDLSYDVILCADVLWLSTPHTDLLFTINKLLKKSSESRVLILSGFHTGRRALVAFFRKALQSGLFPDENVLNGGVFEQHATNGIQRPWTGSFAFPSSVQTDDDQSQSYLDIKDNMDDYVERSKWLLFVSLRWKDLISS